MDLTTPSRPQPRRRLRPPRLNRLSFRNLDQVSGSTFMAISPLQQAIALSLQTEQPQDREHQLKRLRSIGAELCTECLMPRPRDDPGDLCDECLLRVCESHAC